MITYSAPAASHLAHREGLEQLRRDYMLQIIADSASRRSPLRVAPYVLAHTVTERREDLALIKSYAVDEMGWQVTDCSFADAGQPPPLEARRGFEEAWRYAAQGFAHGILAIARPVITTDAEAYGRVLEHLYSRRLFLAFLPGTGAMTTGEACPLSSGVERPSPGAPA
ncbi:hypothetical protein [Streptomyces sp. NPDC017958]|uniref:hypothetical protein n=1 Tax=Streptomyces sp. NPDC017958 TaxID=3365021 RepID=UPI0037AEE78F